MKAHQAEGIRDSKLLLSFRGGPRPKSTPKPKPTRIFERVPATIRSVRLQHEQIIHPEGFLNFLLHIAIQLEVEEPARVCVESCRCLRFPINTASSMFVENDDDFASLRLLFLH